MGGMVTSLTDAVGLTDTGEAESSMNKANQTRQDILKSLQGINLPDEEKLQIALQYPELAGLLEAEEVGPSEFGNIQQDAQLKSNQMEVLRKLRDRSETGNTPEDQFQLEQILGDAAAQENSSRAALNQQLETQGLSDSGTGLIQKLSNAQNTANRSRNEALQLAANSSQNRQQALQNLANLSGTMSRDDISLKQNTASAKDRIAQANAENRQNVSEFNLRAKQNLANQKAQTANEQQKYNAGLEQQRFDNELRKSTPVTSAQNDIASGYESAAQAQAKADNAVISGVTGLGTNYISNLFNPTKK